LTQRLEPLLWRFMGPKSPEPWRTRELSEIDQAAARAIRDRWQEHVLRSDPIDRERVEWELAELYAAYGYGEPAAVEWCAGPRELWDRALDARGGTERLSSPWSIAAWQELYETLPRWYGFRPHTLLQDRVGSELWHAAFRQVQGEQRFERVAWHWTADGYRSTASFSAGWRFEFCALWEYLDEHERRNRAPALRPLLTFAAAVPWWALSSERSLLCDRPTLVGRDHEGRPHAEDGPAFAFADGTAVHAWHGLAIPASYVEEPATPERIDFEPNLELRRVLLERYGLTRYLRERGGKPVAEDEYGRLWRLDFHTSEAEPIVVVEVENSTPEPDGTRRTYTLRVPPDIRTPRAAVAWTFGMPTKTYRPAVET
jgi:hypothetical protein